MNRFLQAFGPRCIAFVEEDSQMSTAAPAPVAETRTDDLLIRSIFEHAARISREQNIDELVRLNADLRPRPRRCRPLQPLAHR